MVTIIDVAKRAQVSAAVVSRVVNGDETLRIAADTRARVLLAVEDLKYTPKRAARSLRMSLPSVISLALPDTTNALNAGLVGGVEQAAMERNLAFNLVRAEHLEREPAWLRRFVGEGRTDGLVIQVPDRSDSTVFDQLIGLPIPIVLINSLDTGKLRTVVYDDYEAMRIAVMTLVESGHRQIGLISGAEFNGPATRRRLAFMSVALEHGIKVRPQWITNIGFSNDEGREAARRLMSLDVRPTGVVVSNVNAAMGFVAEAHRQSATLPDDLSIVSIYDVPYADATWPPLTTVEMPSSMLGYTAVSHLFDENPGESHLIIREPKPVLHWRSSVAPPR